MNLRVVAVETFHSESILSAKMPANTPLTAMVAHGNAENHELVAKLKKEGTEFALEPRPADHPTMAYILGPDGAKTEIVRAGAH